MIKSLYQNNESKKSHPVDNFLGRCSMNVDRARFELATSALQMRCSNQLS